MNKSRLIWPALCLVLSACATPEPKQPTLLSIEPAPPVCELTLCRLPGRPALIVNEDWALALDETEAALTSCAAQVQACIGKQGVMTNAAKGQASVPRTDVPGQDAE